MLNNGLVILISIDFILLFIGKIVFYSRVFKIFSFRDFIRKIQDNLPEKQTAEKLIESEYIDDTISTNNDKSFFRKIWHSAVVTFKFSFKLIGSIILIFFGLAIIVVSIGIPTASIWGTILIAINYSLVYAVVFLFLMKLLSFLFGLVLFKYAKVDKKRTQRVLIMDAIQFTMLSLLIYLAAFGYPMNVYNMIVSPFEWDIVLNNVLSIVIPMVFYALIITNVFALFIRFKNIITKDVKKHRVIRLHQLLFIFIGACFFGILYITDIDLSFMNDMERTMFLQTLEVIKWVITSVFIPLFLYTLNNYKKETTIIRKPRRRTSSLR